MKKLIIILGAATFLGSLKAQQIPLYSNYFFTPYIYNPALSGSSGVTEATVVHRRQWSAIQGSPETSALMLNGALNNQKVGWSVYGFSDQTDILQRLGVYGNYAYHIQLSDNATLSFGLGAGYLNQSIDQDAVRARDQGDIFTVVAPNRGTFDLNAGLNLSIGGFKIGAAAPQLLSQDINYSENAEAINYNLIRHYVFNTQYDFKFGGDKQIISPMVMVRAAENVPIQVDAGMMFNLVEYGYIGAMYRSDYAVTGNIGVNLTDQLTLGYAYDFSLNEYGSNFGTSHEFMLTYRFGSNKESERLENEIKRLKQQQRRQGEETEEIVDEKLEEFKDSYREEMRQELEAQREKMQEQMQQDAASGGNAGNRGNTAGGNRSQTGGGVNTGTTGGGNAQDDPYANTNNRGNNQSGGQVAGGGTAGGERQTTVGSGYYLTAGVFSNEANARQLANRLSARGFNARYFRDSKNNFYYVYLRGYQTYQEADQAKASKLGGSFDGDLWIKIID